jgi:hypothetical protein
MRDDNRWSKTIGKKDKKSKRHNSFNDDDVIVEKTVRRSTTTGVTNRRLNVVGGTSYRDDDVSLVNAHVSSGIADKVGLQIKASKKGANQ